jgi:hypothetical protein
VGFVVDKLTLGQVFLLVLRFSSGGGRDMWHAWKREGKCIRFWWESQKEKDHLKDQDVDRRMGSEWILGGLAEGV